MSAIPADDAQTVVAVFCGSQAVIHGRDQLRIDGFDLSAEQYAPAEATNIAFFLYDDGNGQTSGNPHAIFSFLGSFLTGIDYFIPTASPASVALSFNGRSLNVPNLKSKTEGVVVAVFD